jgi:hypothetical protein
MWGALSDERVRVTGSSNKSVVSMYNLYYILVNVCIYDIYMAELFLSKSK